MMVKSYGYNSVKHGMDFAQDLKLGQYMVRLAEISILPQKLTNCFLCRKFPLAFSSLVRYTRQSLQQRLKLEVSLLFSLRS